MYKAKVYKVMVGAPSDIEGEINIVRGILQQWNLLHSETQNIVLLPLHWSSDAFPLFGKHPQKIINDQVVAKSDIMICIFGGRVGSPTDSYESGTIEEINEHLKAGKQVMIYFKKTVDNNSSEQLAKLNAFKDSIKGDALFWEYTDESIFKDICSNHLQLYINNYLIQDKSIITEDEKKKLDSVVQPLLTEFDLERLTAWTNTDNPQFFQVHFEGGGAIYGLGSSNQYEIKNGKEKIEWNDFFEKLLNLNLIGIEKYDKSGNPVYQLKKAAYDYVNKLK